MTDNTLIMFRELYFLAFGVLIYLLLSLLKIYHIEYLEKETSADTPFKHYFKKLIGKFSSPHNLQQSFLAYFFKSTPQEDNAKGNKKNPKVERVTNIFNGLLTFLKPYLIIGFIWYFLQIWVESKLFYNELKITLAGIQGLLVWINKYFYVKILNANRYLIFLFLAIICVSIPFFFYGKTEKEEMIDTKIKKVKVLFTNSLIYLSILGSISFFGSSTGHFIADKEAKLKELKFEVVVTNDNIPVKIAKILMVHDLVATTQKYDSLIDAKRKEAETLKEKIKAPDVSQSNIGIFSDPYSLNDLRRTTLIKIKGYSDLLEVNSFENVNTTTLQSDTLRNLRTTNTGNISSFVASGLFMTDLNDLKYWQNPDGWNKEKGEQILAKLEKVISSEQYNKKSEKVAEALVDYIFDTGVVDILKVEWVNMPEYKSLKKAIVLVLSENYKKSLSERVGRVITLASKNSIAAAKQVFNEPSPILNWLTNKEMNGFENARFAVNSDINTLLNTEKRAERDLRRNLEEQIKNSLWEKMRRNFLSDLKAGGSPNLIGLNRETFIIAFESWDNYIRNISTETFQLHDRNIEKVFLDYTNKHPELMAAWGYLIISRNTNEVGRYAGKKIGEEDDIKPFDGIFYYHDAEHENYRFSKEYIEEVRKWIIKFCPYTKPVVTEFSPLGKPYTIPEFKLNR